MYGEAGRNIIMSFQTVITSEKAPKAIGCYSLGLCLDGLVLFSGQLPVNPETGKIEAEDAGSQAEQSMKNIGALLYPGGRNSHGRQGGNRSDLRERKDLRTRVKRETRAANAEPRIQNCEYRAANTELRIRKRGAEPGIRSGSTSCFRDSGKRWGRTR